MRARPPTIAHSARAMPHTSSPALLISPDTPPQTLNMLGFSTSNDGRVTPEELRLLVTGARDSGGIETEEAKMVEGVLDLQDMKVFEVMRPRVDVQALEANSSLAEFLRLVNATKYSRIPIYDEEIDRIMGVVIAKDILQFIGKPVDLEEKKVEELMEPTYFVPETMAVQKVLEEMRKRRLHMAIVVDEYGGTAGIVTLEDILEEVSVTGADVVASPSSTSERTQT